MYIMIIIINQTSRRQPFFHFEPQRSWGIPPALSYGGATLCSLPGNIKLPLIYGSLDWLKDNLHRKPWVFPIKTQGFSDICSSNQSNNPCFPGVLAQFWLLNHPSRASRP